MAANDVRSGFARRRVLVIDDDIDFHSFMLVLLEGRGYTVFSALDAAAGFELSELIQPDVVMLDAGIEGVDPLDLTASISGRGKRPAVLIVADRHANEADFEMAGAAGAAGIIERPFDIDVVMDQVALAVQASPREPLM
jgi:DNA-binding response OmpR family regulator